jgi:hypothetical protein
MLDVVVCVIGIFDQTASLILHGECFTENPVTLVPGVDKATSYFIGSFFCRWVRR